MVDKIIRNKNGDTLKFVYFDSENEDYEFYDSERANSVFYDKTILPKMPGQFVFGVKNKKEKLYRYLLFSKPDTAIIIGRNYLDAIPNLEREYDFSNRFSKVVHIRYDSAGPIVRENQLIAVIDNLSRDTTLYIEENYFIVKKTWNVVGGTFAMFDNKERLKEMKALCDLRVPKP